MSRYSTFCVWQYAITHTVSMMTKRVWSEVSRFFVSTNSERSPAMTRSITRMRNSVFWKAYARLTRKGWLRLAINSFSKAIFLRHDEPRQRRIISLCITFIA